jgi:hypothetical protein
MSRPTDAARIREGLARQVVEHKADLSIWLRHRLDHGHSATAIALLETAIELFIEDLGEQDALEFVQVSFIRVAAKVNTKGEA